MSYAPQGSYGASGMREYLAKRKALRESVQKAKLEAREHKAKVKHRRKLTAKLNDALARRIRKKGNLFFWSVLIGGIVMVKYLCDNGALGCTRDNERSESERSS